MWFSFHLLGFYIVFIGTIGTNKNHSPYAAVSKWENLLWYFMSTKRTNRWITWMPITHFTLTAHWFDTDKVTIKWLSWTVCLYVCALTCMCIFRHPCVFFYRNAKKSNTPPKGSAELLRRQGNLACGELSGRFLIFWLFFFLILFLNFT